MKGISFTGSVGAGRVIGSLASGHGIKSVLELGGSDPFIITKNCDINKAIEDLLNSRLLNWGQVCSSPKRVYIHEDHIE